MTATNTPEDVVESTPGAAIRGIAAELLRSCGEPDRLGRQRRDGVRHRPGRRPVGTDHAALGQRARVTIAVAEAAGVDPRHEIDRARRPGLTPWATTDEVDRNGRPRPLATGSRDRCAAAGPSAARDLVARKPESGRCPATLMCTTVHKRAKMCI